MTVEEVVLNRNAKCRWTMSSYSGGHSLNKGDAVVKIHDFAVNGNKATVYLCKECAAEMMANLSVIL